MYPNCYTSVKHYHNLRHTWSNKIRQRKFCFLGRDRDRIVPGERGKISRAALCEKMVRLVVVPRFAYPAARAHTIPPKIHQAFFAYSVMPAQQANRRVFLSSWPPHTRLFKVHQQLSCRFSGLISRLNTVNIQSYTYFWVKTVCSVIENLIYFSF